MSGNPGRLLVLLSLLQARRDWPGQLLAERLEISSRTVRRDVDRLRELGYPVAAVKGPDGGYRLDPGRELPPLLFDDEQAVALALALQVAAVGGAGTGDGAARALATVRQVMPARLRHRIDNLEITAIAGGDRTDVDPAVLVALSEAVRAREVLRLDYARPSLTGADDAGSGAAPTSLVGSSLSPRRVEPHHVVFRTGRWYLLAWDLDRADWRTFRVDRLHPRTPTGPRFSPRAVPGGDAADFVSARFKGSAGADRWPCRGEVLLDLPADEVVPYVGGGDATVEVLDRGRCRLVMGAWSWTGLAATIGRFDADMQIVGPPLLRDACSRLARRYTAAAKS